MNDVESSKLYYWVVTCWIWVLYKQVCICRSINIGLTFVNVHMPNKHNIFELFELYSIAMREARLTIVF